MTRHQICSICGGQIKRTDAAATELPTGHSSANHSSANHSSAIHSSAIQTSNSALTPDPTLTSGDVIEIQEINASQKTELKIGDLVAIHHQSKLRAKRIAALPGDQLSMVDRRILVNNLPLEDIIARRGSPTLWVSRLPIVDEDWRHAQSRWKPIGRITPWRRRDRSAWSWQRSIANIDQPGQDESGDWLVYHHQNVHDKNRPSAVLDDYAFNVGLARQLNQVDRIAVTATLAVRQEHESPIELQTAFWTGNGVFLARSTVPTSHHWQQDHWQQDHWQQTYFDASPHATDDSSRPPVTQRAPLAIRVASGPDRVELRHLVVRRFIQYRALDSQPTNTPPHRIAKDHVFVVGDNVPTSEDSRQWGEIPMDEIVGKIELQQTIDDHQLGDWSHINQE